MRSDLKLRRLRWQALSACAVAGLVLALSAAAAPARSGDPDPSFGSNGRVVAAVSDFAAALPTSMAVDQEGRIVVAGFLVRPFYYLPVLARFTPGGSLDRTFGVGGVVRPSWEGTGPITDVAIDAGGRIVLAGGYRGPASLPATMGDYDFAIGRLLESGASDPSFAGDGLLTIDSGTLGSDLATDLALDAEGRIVVSGSADSDWLPPEDKRLVALRVTASGLADPSFGDGGIARFDFLGPSAGEAVAIDPQGRIVVVGRAAIAESQSVAAFRFTPAGQPDPTFGAGGWAQLDFNVSAGPKYATDVAIDALGRLVLVGTAGLDGPDRIALAGRLLSDGSPDPSFGGDGSLTLNLLGLAEASELAIDRRGRILVVGSRGEGAAEGAFLARLEPGGTFSSSFARSGIRWEDFASPVARGAAVAVDSAGRYLIAGGAYGSKVSGFALARYLGDEPTRPRRRCQGKRATVVGTNGADNLRGTPRRDVVAALAGNDRVRSLAGADLVCAGPGRDLVKAGSGNDTVFGGPGRDRLFGQAGTDRLRGGPGRDAIRGGPGRDP